MHVPGEIACVRVCAFMLLSDFLLTLRSPQSNNDREEFKVPLF